MPVNTLISQKPTEIQKTLVSSGLWESEKQEPLRTQKCPLLFAYANAKEPSPGVVVTIKSKEGVFNHILLNLHILLSVFPLGFKMNEVRIMSLLFIISPTTSTMPGMW